MAVNKAVAIGVSVVLCVGVIIGVVAIVHHSNSKDKDEVTAQKKAVTNMCSSTRYQETCEKNLNNADSEDPKELMSKAVTSTEEAVKKFYDYINSLADKAKENNQTQQALDICKGLMESAGMSLQKTIQGIKEAEINNFQDSINDLRTWMSMVVSFGETCLDGFDNESSTKDINRDAIAKAMEEADHLNIIALEIVTKLNEILPKFGININLDIPTTQRRLLSSDDEYPEWFSAADRKLLAVAPPPKPNAIVGPGGQFKTIMDALRAYPKGLKGRYVVYVKAGVYNEQVLVDKKWINVFMYGDGPDKTKVTGSKNFGIQKIKTMQTSTFGSDAEGFVAKDMGFENTAGPQGHQAVAFRANGDKTALFNCKFDGFQDTFYTQSGRQLYKRCTILGTLDFIMGDAATIIQDSKIIIKKPMPSQQNTIVAPGKKDGVENTGLVIQNCQIEGEPALVAEIAKYPTYLGRPWKPFSTAVFIESDLPDIIKPEGWMDWIDQPANKDNSFLGEYKNRGRGADVSRRVKWRSIHATLNKAEATRFTAEKMLHSKNVWIPETGIEFTPGLLS